MVALTALADPTRRRIVEMLAEREMTAGEIAANFSVSTPAVSQHLKVLRDCRLVRVRGEAQRRFYELEPEGLVELDRWMIAIKESMARKLSAVERLLKSAETTN